MAEYASKGIAGAGLGLGIAGTALGVLTGMLGNGTRYGGGNIVVDEDISTTSRFHRHVSHYELGLVREISEKDALIAKKDSEIYTNNEVAKLTADFNNYKIEVERRFCYDEKLIEANKCAIEKVDAYGKCNYYQMAKVIRPWDICPQVQLAETPTAAT